MRIVTRIADDGDGICGIISKAVSVWPIAILVPKTVCIEALYEFIGAFQY
jgi:hypothetical protein